MRKEKESNTGKEPVVSQGGTKRTAGRGRGFLARTLGVVLAATLGVGIGAAVAPNAVKETEVYAKPVSEKNKSQKQGCENVSNGQAPSGYTNEIGDGSVYRGKNTRSAISKDYILDSDINDFATPLPYGDTFVDTSKLNWDNPDNFIIDIRDPHFVWISSNKVEDPNGTMTYGTGDNAKRYNIIDVPRKDKNGNTSTSDPFGTDKKITFFNGGQETYIAYMGPIQSYLNDIKDPASDEGKNLVIEADDGDYLYSITYLNAVTLPDGTRGNLVLKMKRVEIEASFTVNETDKNGIYDKALIQIQGPNSLGVDIDQYDEDGNPVNKYETVAIPADEAKAIVEAANGALTTNQKLKAEDGWFNEKKIRHAAGGIYDLAIEVVDSEMNPVNGTISYAAHDMDFATHQNVWGRTVDGVDKYKYAEALAVLDGSKSYALVPNYGYGEYRVDAAGNVLKYKADENGNILLYKYTNGAFVRDDNGELIPASNGQPYPDENGVPMANDGTTVDKGWVPVKPTTGVDENGNLPDGGAPLKVERIPGTAVNNADGVRFSSKGILNIRDKAGTFKNVPFNVNEVTVANGQIYTAGTAPIQNRDLSKYINTNVKKLFYGKLKDEGYNNPANGRPMTSYSQVTAEMLYKYLGDASWRIERQDANNDLAGLPVFDTGFAVLLNATKSTLRWSGSRQSGAGINTNLFDSSIYTYVEPTRGTGGGIYIETYDMNNQCAPIMSEGTKTMARNSEITFTAVPEMGYRVSRILIGNTNYGKGSEVTGLSDYTEYVIDGNDIKVNGEVKGSFGGDDVTDNPGMKTGTVELDGFYYNIKGERTVTGEKIVIERNADGTVDISLPEIDDPMHVHVDFDTDYYFYKVWKEGEPTELVMTAAPAGFYPAKVEIPFPTGETDETGAAITEMVVFDIDGSEYTATNGVWVGTRFVLTPENTIAYVEIDPDTGEEKTYSSNVVLQGDRFVHILREQIGVDNEGNPIIVETIDKEYPLIMDERVADLNGSDARNFNVDDTEEYTDDGYVTVIGKDALDSPSPGHIVWKIKYPSEGVQSLGWPALPAEKEPNDTNHDARNHNSRYYWFVTEEAPGWSTEGYDNTKAEAPGKVDSIYADSIWGKDAVMNVDRANKLIHGVNEHEYAFLSVFENGGEITNVPSIVVHGVKDWQDDLDNAFDTRQDIWLHIDAKVTRTDGTSYGVPDILPAQQIKANDSGNGLKKSWGEKKEYTTGVSTVKVVESIKKIPDRAKLQKNGSYKWGNTYYWINELKLVDINGDRYEYTIRETLDREGRQPVVKGDATAGLLGYTSEDVADWNELQENKGTYEYEYKYNGEDRTMNLTSFTGTVENTYETIDFAVTKKWYDNKEDSEHTAEEIIGKLTLYDVNGKVDLANLQEHEVNIGTEDEPEMEPYGAVSGEPDSGKEITVTWKHLPMYVIKDGSLVPAGYYVVEDKIDGYATKYTNIDDSSTDANEAETTDKAYNNGVITNTQLIKVNVEKVWDDVDNQDGLRGDIDVTLFQNGVEYKAEGVENAVTLVENEATKSTTTDEDDTWTWNGVWTNLPYTDQFGTPYNYTAKETDKPDGYESEDVDNQQIIDTEWNDAKDTLTFKATNKHDPETIDFTITKVWDDDNDHDGFRPKDGEVTYTIKADGTALTADELKKATIKGGTRSGATITAKTTGSDGDKVTVEGLPKNRKAGQKITYTIEEAAVTNYTIPEITGDQSTGFTVKNVHTPETVNVTVNKVWDDKGDQDGKRPNNVVFNLVADGIATELTKILNEDNDWTATFEALDKYKAGKEVIYTVIEALKDDLAKAGYTADESKGNKAGEYTITNKYTPEKVTIKATKVWDDEDNKYGLRKDAEFTLMADGKKAEIDDAVKTIAKDATGDALTVEWTVDKYSDGEEIDYTVSEGNVSPYSKDISGDAENGFIITNKYPPTEETTTVKRTITYTYLTEDGEEASETVVQEVTLKRIPTVIDEAGGVVEWSDWEFVDGDTNSVDTPVIDGWTPDKAAVDTWTIEYDESGMPKDAFEHVVYKPQPPVGTPDETYGGKGESQTGTPTFEVTTPTTPDGSDNEIVEVKLIDPQTGEPTDAKEVSVPEGTYKLNDDGTITFTPNDPEYVGDPTPVKVRGTDKNGLTADTTYTPHIVDNTDTVKRTITYEYSTGDPVLDENGEPLVVEEEVTFTGTVDPKTGKVTYPDSEKEKSFPETNSPDKDGWTPDTDPVNEDKVHPGDDDIVRKVIYNPNDLTATPDETWGLKGQPQTGEPKFKMLTPTGPDGEPNEIVSRKLIDPSTGEPTDEPVYIDGQGTYEIDPDTGKITFTPDPDYVGNPTPIGVTAKDRNGQTAKTTYTPHVVDPEDEDEATRTIHCTYLTEDGVEVIDDTVQTVTLKRHAKSVDPKTGKVTEWDKWEPAKFPAFENPDDEAGSGWITTDEVGELDVKEPGDKGTEYVVYKPKPPVAEKDETWGLKDQPQTGTPIFSVDTEKTPEGEDNTFVSIELLDEDGNPADKVTVPEGTYELEKDADGKPTGNIIFTPNEGFVGDPTPVKVQATDKLGGTAKTTYTPHVVDSEDKGEAKRTIHYTYLTEDGTEVTGDVTQSVELTRKAKSINPETGDVEWDDWSTDELDPEPNPDDEAGEGWSTTDKVDKLEVTEPGDKGTVYVVYQPEKPVGTPDETYGAKNQPQTGEPDFEVTTKKMPDGSDNEIAKVELLDADGNPTDKVTVPEGTYKLNDDGTITFTPNKDFVGDPTSVNVRGTDKLGGTAETTYIPHVVDNVETEEVTRTIEYEYSDGTKVVDKDGNPIVKEETLKFTRTGTVDPKTGKVTYNEKDWKADTTDTFEKVVSPTEDNPGDATNLKDWTPDRDVDKKTVKATDDDIYEKVIYNPKGVKATPDETYGLKGEPQTGKPDFKQETELLPDGTKNEIVERKLIDPQTGDPVDEVKIPGQGTYKMNPGGTVTFTPEPDFVGNPSPVGVVGTDKLGNTAKTTYTPHVVDPTDEGTATRTIHYTYLAPDGEEVTEDTKQTATLVRHAKKIDPKTRKVTEWGDWEKATLPAVDNPDDKATKDGKSWTTTDKVEDLEVTEPGDKGVVNVVYVEAPVPPEEKVDYKTVERKIEYKYYDKDGNEASVTITQKAELKRTPKKVDPDTGEVTEWNDWEIIDNKDNKTVSSPEIEGWTPDKTSVPPMDIDLTKEDPQDGINDELVVYTPEPPVGTPKKTYGKIGKPQSTDAKKLFEVTTPTTDEKDEKGNPIPNEIVKIELIDPETGEPAKTTVDPETGKTIYGPVPAYGINPETGEREQVGTYELDPETGIVTFKPNETFTGTPEPATLKATDKNGKDTKTTYTPNIPDKRQKVTVDREITYMYKKADGTEAPVLDEKGEPVKVVQTVTFVRETNVDPETGALTWTDWEPEEAVMGKVVSPTEDKTEAASGQKATDLEGWTPDKDVDEFKVTIDPETEQPFEPADDVVYYICGPVGSDKETWGAPGEQQKGTPKFTEGTGKITKYELTDPDPDDPNKKTVPGEGTYVLNPETGEITFTPEDGFTGKGTGVTVKATDENGKTAEGKYNPNVPEPETQTGKRTITYLYDDGTPVLDENGNPIVEEQIEEFTRTPKKVDPETGKVTEWNEWDKKDYPEKDSPEVDGYTPNKDKVDEDSAKPGDNKEEIVIYKKTSTDPTRETETETVKRVIHYRYLTRDGKIADEDVEQTVTFTREKVTSPEGEVTYTEWQVAAGDKNFAEVPSPVKTGYDVDREKVDAVSVAPETEDMEEWVIYTPTKDPSGEVEPPVGSDKETYGGRGQTQSDTPEFTPGTGKIPEKGAYTLEDPDADNPLKKTVPGEGVYTLDPDTGKVTFEPEPDFVGDGTGVTVKVTDENGLTATGKYTPHVVDNVQKSTATKTVQYYYNNGEPVPEDIAPTQTQEIEFERTGEVDPKTGKITKWNDWTPSEFDKVDSPKVDGFTPNKESVEAEPANPGDNVKDIVIYVPEDEIIEETQTKTITRIIKYRYLTQDGEEAFADVKQTVTFSRIKTTNKTTGEETHTDWIPDAEEMEAVDSPVLDNYNVDRASVDALTIDPDEYENGRVIEEYVIYTPKTIWVTYVDEDGKTIYLEKTTEPKAGKGQKQEEPDAPADPVKLGAKFIGWDRTVDEEGNITYTAKWEPVVAPEETIWVTYIDPDGTVYLEKVTEPKAKDGETQEEPDAPADPVKEGYVFKGWDRTVDEEGNITYIAKWEPVGTDPADPTTPTDPTDDSKSDGNTPGQSGTQPASGVDRKTVIDPNTGRQISVVTPSGTKTPGTGDRNNSLIWIIAAVAAAGAGVTAVVIRRRKRED